MGWKKNNPGDPCNPCLPCDDGGGGVTCPCDCYDPDDPDCNQENESAVDAPSIAVSGVTNVYQVTHLFEQDYAGVLRSSGSVCGCYRAVREYNTDFQVTGLSALNGTYPAITQKVSTFVNVLGPCTTPTNPTGLSTEGCGDCTEGCDQVVWMQAVPVTATFRVWWHDTKYVFPIPTFGCPDAPLDESSDVTTNYTGYAFISNLNVIAGDQGYPATVLEPEIRVWLWATGATNPSIEIVLPFGCSSTVADPGHLCVGTRPGDIWRGFSSCGEEYYLGLGQETSSISSLISCHPQYRRAVHAPEFSCYTGSDHPTIGNISCPGNSHSGYVVLTAPTGSDCSTVLADPDQYITYSYDSTAFSANFALSM